MNENICGPGQTIPPPPAGSRETAPGGCNGTTDPVAGCPIKLASGNTYILQTDVSIPGLAGGLELTRIWNSLWPTTQQAFSSGLFGPNWRSTYEERVFSGDDGTVKHSRSDGSFWSFSLNHSTGLWQVTAPANGGAILATGTSNWTLTLKNGEKRLFDNASGSLIAIIDRNGNTTQLSYDGHNRLTTVADPASRHLYFSYANTSFPRQVTAATSDANSGISISYAYDQQGRLVTVTAPDGTTNTFEYNAQSLIAPVKDSQGVVLESHTYDSSGRGLTSSRAGGVNAVTVSYPQ